MDSFFAAADNLDHLLDELEENEDNDLLGSPAKQTKTTDTPISKIPLTNQDSSKDISEPPSTKPNGILEVSDQLEDAQSANFTKTEILTLYSPKDSMILNQNISSKLPLKEIDNLNTSTTEPMKVPTHVRMVDEDVDSSRNDPIRGLGFTMPIPVMYPPNSHPRSPIFEPNSPDAEFVVIENPNVEEAPQSNSELLMEIFGAVSTPGTQSQESITPDESRTLSPLNPFRANFKQPEFEFSSSNQSGLFTLDSAENWQSREPNLEQLSTPLKFNKSNPFLVEDQNDSAQLALPTNTDIYSSPGVGTTQNAIVSLVPPGDILEMNIKDGMGKIPPQNASSSMEEKMDVEVKEELSYMEMKNTINHLEESPPFQVEDSGSNHTSSSSDEASYQLHDSKESPSYSESKMILDDQAESSVFKVEDSGNNRTFMSNNHQDSYVNPSNALSPPAIVEKQERLSVGFMRDVAVNEEEFERFWAEMEEADHKEEDSDLPEDSKKQESHGETTTRQNLDDPRATTIDVGGQRMYVDHSSNNMDAPAQNPTPGDLGKMALSVAQQTFEGQRMHADDIPADASSRNSPPGNLATMTLDVVQLTDEGQRTTLKVEGEKIGTDDPTPNVDGAQQIATPGDPGTMTLNFEGQIMQTDDPTNNLDPGQPNHIITLEDDTVIISSLTQDELVTDAEFEQFLVTEGATALPLNIHDGETERREASDITPPPQNNHDQEIEHIGASDITHISVPVAHTVAPNAIHQGSPTFPLERRTSRNREVSEVTEVRQGDDERSQPESRLRLNIDERDGGNNAADHMYPETPPPPYTEEMHVNYERSLSPTHLSSPVGQHIEGQTQQETGETQSGQLQNSQEDEIDFSVLPPAILESITRPGGTKPSWVPDQDAPQCNNCAQKFTFTRRRHHCRACGRVFCATCCNQKSELAYLDYKEARVCLMCFMAVKQADALAEISRSRSAQNLAPPPTAPPPPETAEEAMQAVSATNEPNIDSHMLNVEDSVAEDQPQIPVQQHTTPSSQEDIEVEGAMALTRTPSTKSVRFSDGTRPTHPDEMPSTPPPPSRMNRVRKKHSQQSKDPNSVEIEQLPPIIIAHGENGAYAVQENPDPNVVMNLLESGDQNPQSFVLNPNLIIHIKVTSHANRQCWCYWSEGMDNVGQREIALILEREGLGDRQLSQDAFTLFTHIFDRARKGKIFNTTDFMPRTMLGVEDEEVIFGLKENAGFLFVQATSQCLDGLTCFKRKVARFSDGFRSAENDDFLLRSMLFAILVQKNEAPWATLFPMRLILRLGMETKQYPCPLFSIRRREPVYCELGHTIMAILCDFRNFKYRVISIPGLRVVTTSTGSISVQIPCNRFTDTIKIMNSSNESVLAIGTGTFGPKIRPQDEVVAPCDTPCDSHLVCVQDQQTTNYHTEVLSMKNTKAMNTGAAFVIFNGALKSDGSYNAKCAIVEDGIMIELLPEKMEELRGCLRSMEDFRIDLGKSTQAPSEASDGTTGSVTDPSVLEVKWVEEHTAFNIGMFSPIDGTPFEGVVGFNVQGRSEQKGRKHTLRWNQVFFLASTSDPLDMSRLAEQVANGCFLALTPVIHELSKHRQYKVGVRVTIHPENVGYVAGSGLRDLPPACMNALDEHLIQTIHSAANNVAVEQEAVIIELLFSILLSRPAYRTA